METETTLWESKPLTLDGGGDGNSSVATTNKPSHSTEGQVQTSETGKNKLPPSESPQSQADQKKIHRDNSTTSDSSEDTDIVKN